MHVSLSASYSVHLGNAAPATPCAGRLQPPPATYSVGFQPRALVLANVNGGGRPDLVAVSAHAIGVRLCGTQGFGSATRYPGLGEEPITAALVDVNCDGHPDLLTNHYSYQQGAQGRVQVRLGRPEGGWNPPTTYSVGTHSAERFAVADLNGDSRPDLVTLNRNTSTVLLADRRP